MNNYKLFKAVQTTTKTHVTVHKQKKTLLIENSTNKQNETLK